MVQKTDYAREIIAAMLTASPERQVAALQLLSEGVVIPAQPKRQEKYETLKEIGKQLGYHPCTLWRFGVPGHSLGGRRRFLVSEVCDYLKTPVFLARVAQLKAERREKATGKTSVAGGVR